PSQAAPWGYPPASFPFLGLSVIAGGGPLAGARIFAGAEITAMALGFYLLARSLFQLPVVALIVEGAFVVQPDFQQLYYFGSFPNMFGFIFFFLALAFGLRFLRSRRSLHLGLFWGAMTAAVLAHALVAVTLVGLVMIAALLLLLYRRLPRELFTTPTGIVGLVGFGVLSATYYVGSRVLGAGGPNYLTNASLAQTTSESLLPVILRPFYLEAGSTAVNGSGFAVSFGWALSFIIGTIVVLALLFLLLRILAPQVVSYRHLILASWLMSVFGLALICLVLNLGADYRRFAYFLYPAILLGVVIPLDLALAWLLTPVGVLSAPTPGPRRFPPKLRPARFRWRGGGRHVTAALLVTIAAVVLLASSNAYTRPSATNYEKFFTGPGHDAAFVDAMGAIASSGIPGSIFVSTEMVDRWPVSLTARNVFEVRSPTGFAYTPGVLLTDEQAFLALNYRYTVTNSLVAATLPGVTKGFFNATPVFALYGNGVLHQVLQVSPQSVFVTVDGASASSAFPKGSPLPEVLLPADPTNATFALRFHGSGFTVDEVVHAIPGTDALTINYTATPTGPENLSALRVKVVSATSNFDTVNALSSTSFSWYTPTLLGNFTSFGNLTGGASISSLTPSSSSNGKGATVTAVTNSTAPNGSRSLSLGFYLSSPGTSNPTKTIAGFVSSLDVLANWDARFGLFWSGSYATGPAAVAFFVNEYGARPFYSSQEWSVLLLPAPVSSGPS
ncbi:MAG TPA: hypothetical protein VIZ68_01040, partial [Thermoplasmata archaeon]